MTKAEFYNTGIDKINEVYQIFKDYFTEERVDLRNVIDEDRFVRESVENNGSYVLDTNLSPYILVHFPEVTITNEYEDSVNVKDLWAKVYLTFKGTIRSGFLLNRSHYYRSHWNSDYMHSHISGIPKARISDFLSPCLGSGPIRDTIHSLVHNNDELIWQLFCRELDVYVRTESISGGPYRRLKNIGTTTNRRRMMYSFNASLYFNYNNSTFPLNYLREFVKHVIESNALKFNFNGSSYSLAMHYIDYYIVISNLFIEWYNKAYNENKVNISYNQLLDRNILYRADIVGNEIFYTSTQNSNTNESSPVVLTFKGRDIHLTIENDTESSVSQSYNILNPSIAVSLLRHILAIINLKYGRTEETVDTASTVELRLSV